MSRVTRLAGLALFVVVACLLVASVWLQARPVTLRIAGGSRGGTTLSLAEALAHVLGGTGSHVTAVAVPTGGGIANAELVEEGRAELGLVPNNAPGGDRLRTLVPLYDEALQVVVRRSQHVTDLRGLEGRTVAVGAVGSGTARVTEALLKHLKLDPARLSMVYATHDEAASAFLRGEVDAVFALTGLNAPAVARMLGSSDAELLSLGDPHDDGSTIAGVRVAIPYLSPFTIPAHAYGSEPQKAVGTVAVQLLLVAHAEMPDALAAEVTRAVFLHKSALVTAQENLVALGERFETSDLRFAIHPGANNYYRRDEPPPFLAWADTFSLALTLVVLAWSGVAGMRAHRTKARKDRVDVYYADLQAVSDRILKATSVSELLALRDQLHGLRRKAFHDLMSERLEANESFTIFQNYLRSELLEIESALADLRGHDSARTPERPSRSARAGVRPASPSSASLRATERRVPAPES